MAQPHPALIDVAAGRAAGTVADELAFLESAAEHRLSGLAFWASANGHLALSGATRRELAAAKLKALDHNRRVAGSAAGIMSEMKALGWVAAIFKGVATEVRWYPEAGCRPTADADLLVAPHGRGDLDELVAELDPKHALLGRIQHLVDRNRIQSIDLQWEGIWIDLHFDPFKVGVALPGLEVLWDRLARIELAGSEYWALDAETSLLQASIHLVKDRFSRLYGFADVARIAADPELDWAWIQSFSRQLGLRLHLNEALRVVAEVMRVEIPYDPAIRSRLWRTIWPRRTMLRGSIGMTRRVRTHYWIPFMMQGRRFEAAKWWSRIVVPPADIVDYMHPQTSGPYPWRLIQYRTQLARERHIRNRAQRRNGNR